MDFDKKIIKIGLLLILITLVLNINIKLNSKLEEPVFLKIYMQRDLTKDFDNQKYQIKNFNMKYIVEKSYPYKIKDIKFKEEPKIKVDLHKSFEEEIQKKDLSLNDKIKNYRRFEARNLYLDIDFSRVYGKFEELELNNIIVTLDNNKELEINLGQIIIYNNKNEDIIYNGHFNENDYYEFRVTASRDLTINKIDYGNLKEIDKVLETSFGEEKIKDLINLNKKLKMGQQFKLNHEFKPHKNILFEYTFYEIRPQIHYQTKNGQQKSMGTYELIYNPYNLEYRVPIFDDRKIYRYLKLRGKI